MPTTKITVRIPTESYLSLGEVLASLSKKRGKRMSFNGWIIEQVKKAIK